MKPLVSITGHISVFYEMMQAVQEWTVANGTSCATDPMPASFLSTVLIFFYPEPPLCRTGVDAAASRQFIAAFYSSMAQNAERSPEAFGGTPSLYHSVIMSSMHSLLACIVKDCCHCHIPNRFLSVSLHQR